MKSLNGEQTLKNAEKPKKVLQKKEPLKKPVPIVGNSDQVNKEIEELKQILEHEIKIHQGESKKDMKLR